MAEQNDGNISLPQTTFIEVKKNQMTPQGNTNPHLRGRLRGLRGRFSNSLNICRFIKYIFLYTFSPSVCLNFIKSKVFMNM
jgi:hypothetical protein